MRLLIAPPPPPPTSPPPNRTILTPRHFFGDSAPRKKGQAKCGRTPQKLNKKQSRHQGICRDVHRVYKIEIKPSKLFLRLPMESRRYISSKDSTVEGFFSTGDTDGVTLTYTRYQYTVMYREGALLLYVKRRSAMEVHR